MRVDFGFVMAFRPKLYRKWAESSWMDRTTYAKNDRAMAAPTVEFSNPRDIVYGLLRLFIHRFRVVNAIAGVISHNAHRPTSSPANRRSSRLIPDSS
jgi:hypothetical protein